MSSWLRLLSGSLFLFSAACGPSGSGDDDGSDGGVQPGSLVVTPGDVTLTVSGGVAQSQSYTATYYDDGGHPSDVTADTSFTLESSVLGSFAGNLFTSRPDRAGRTTVTGTWSGHTATAQLTVMLEHVVITTGAPSDAPGLFGDAQPGGAAPALVYPGSGVILPPNLEVIEFQFQPGAGNDLFELTFTGELVTLEVYLVCNPVGGGCGFSPDQDLWELLSTAGRGEEAMYYTLRGLQQSAPTLAGTSETQALTFAADDLEGGIYYWNAAGGAIMRYEFGLRGQTAERYLDAGQTGATTCVGCHTLSRQGDRIAVGLDIPGPAGIEAYTVATRGYLWGEGGGTGFGTGGANWATFSPDGNQIITSAGSGLVLRDAATGGNSQTVVQNATMPDWSADGSKVVFARSSDGCSIALACSGPGVGKGNIVITTAGSWSDAATVAPASGGNNYYPAFSPDSAWVSYNRSMLSDSYDAADAQVWVVPAAGGQPIRLAHASPDPGGDSWPKWAPFIHTYKHGRVMWLTFSSRRDYGLRLINSQLADDQKRAQVWMVGFDPDQAAAGNDGSFTAFWLPFQDLASGNHIAQWVETVDRQPCTDTSECSTGEFCEGGHCYPHPD